MRVLVFQQSNNIKHLKRKASKAKLDSFRRVPKYKCGYEVLHSFADAEPLDKEHKNTKWVDARATDFDKLDEYKVFKDLGHPKDGAKIPTGFQTIRIHIVYDVKNDERHQARVVT